VGVILSVQGAAFVRERSQENPRNDAVAAPHVVGKVFCVGERVKEPQCSKQQLIDFMNYIKVLMYLMDRTVFRKNSSNSTKQSPSNVDSRSVRE
jgi:hypothetical protein